MNERIQFIESHWLPCRSWPEGRLGEWLSFFDRHAGVGEVRDSLGKLCGLALARAVDNVWLTDRYSHTEKGGTIYVDLAIAAEPKAFALLGDCMVKRFGQRDWVAFKRSKYHGRLFLFSWQRFSKLLTQFNRK